MSSNTEKERSEKIHCQILDTNKSLLFETADSDEEDPDLSAVPVTKFSDILPLGNVCMYVCIYVSLFAL